MPVPGYDPNDLEEVLRNRLSDPERRELLSESELEAYESGANLVEALDEETIERVVDG